MERISCFNMKILSDFHHSSLYSSLLYTLEGRLGYEVYRQIEETWFKKGFWKINRQKDTIQQYLGTYGYQPTDGTPSLNNTLWVKDGVYYSKDPNTGQIHKAITYETFLDMDWDVIIASIPQHIDAFKRLAHMKKAKFIFQEGNNFNLPARDIPNLMASTVPRSLSCHSVFYHQEFDLGVFRPTEPAQTKEIHNYMNVLHNYPESYDYFLALEEEMPDYTFKMYGSQNRDGCITGIQNLADSMRRAEWIYHNKPGGDGYGHVLHNTFAVGVPLIVNKRHYEGQLGGQLMDDRACVIMDGLPVKELASIIRNREERRSVICEEAYKRFCDTVDFEKEAKQIQKFMENLV